MNERIKKLAKQAKKFATKNETYNLAFVMADFEQKFAELIVGECLGIIDEEGSHEGGSIRSMEAIKEHFGVKE